MTTPRNPLPKDQHDLLIRTMHHHHVSTLFKADPKHADIATECWRQLHQVAPEAAEVLSYTCDLAADADCLFNLGVVGDEKGRAALYYRAAIIIRNYLIGNDIQTAVESMHAAQSVLGSAGEGGR